MTPKINMGLKISWTTLVLYDCLLSKASRLLLLPVGFICISRTSSDTAAEFGNISILSRHCHCHCQHHHQCHRHHHLADIYIIIIIISMMSASSSSSTEFLWALSPITPLVSFVRKVQNWYSRVVNPWYQILYLEKLDIWASGCWMLDHAKNVISIKSTCCLFNQQQNLEICIFIFESIFLCSCYRGWLLTTNISL